MILSAFCIFLTLICSKVQLKRYGYLGNDLAENIELNYNPQTTSYNVKRGLFERLYWGTCSSD